MWYSFLDTSSLLCMNAIPHISCSPQGSPFSNSQTVTKITPTLLPSCINTPSIVTVLNAPPITARYSSFLYYRPPTKLLGGNVFTRICLFTRNNALDLTVQPPGLSASSPPRYHTWEPPAPPLLIDIWWPSLETCSNLSTWGPTLLRQYWHLLAEASMLRKRVVHILLECSSCFGKCMCEEKDLYVLLIWYVCCAIILNDNVMWYFCISAKNKKSFQSNANHPLANRYLGYKMSKFEHARGAGTRLVLVGGSHVICDWSMASRVVVTWGPPVDRQTHITFPQPLSAGGN